MSIKRKTRLRTDTATAYRRASLHELANLFRSALFDTPYRRKHIRELIRMRCSWF